MSAAETVVMAARAEVGTAIAVTPRRQGLVHRASQAAIAPAESPWRMDGTTLCGRRFSGWVGAEAAFGREACGNCAHYAEREAAR